MAHLRLLRSRDCIIAVALLSRLRMWSVLRYIMLWHCGSNRNRVAGTCHGDELLLGHYKPVLLSYSA